MIKDSCYSWLQAIPKIVLNILFFFDHSIVGLGNDLELHPRHLAQRPAEPDIGGKQLEFSMDEVEHRAEVELGVYIFIFSLALTLSLDV